MKFKYENSCVCSHRLTEHNVWIWQIPNSPCIREVHPHCWFVRPTTLRYPFSIAQISKLWNLHMKTVMSIAIDWLFTSCKFDKYLKAHALERSTPWNRGMSTRWSLLSQFRLYTLPNFFFFFFLSCNVKLSTLCDMMFHTNWLVPHNLELRTKILKKQ